MKKKLLALALAACTLCGTVAFTACGNGNSDNGGNGEPSGSGTATAMSEEEWKAALDRSQYTNFIAVMREYGFGYDDVDMIMKADLDNYKWFYVDSMGEDNYRSKEGDEYFWYFDWKYLEYGKILRDDSDIEEYEEIYEFEHLLALTLVDSYSLFTYDEENDKYVGTDVPVNGHSCGVEMQFADGKLTYACYDLTPVMEGAEITITYTDYGNTEVDLPKDFIIYHKNSGDGPAEEGSEE